MNSQKRSVIFFLGFVLLIFAHVVYAKDNGKIRLLVVDSYHKGYNWSETINDGFCDAMVKLGYFDDSNQGIEYNKNDYVETSKVIINRLWLDKKRKKSKEEITKSAEEATRVIVKFNPDLIFLGDDNAAKFIGPKFLDSKIPVVFWGLNNTPVKYGLVDSKEKPGHNVTGVYQSGYYPEGLMLLKTIVPEAKTFAVIADDSLTGRAMIKALIYNSRKGNLPLKLHGIISTSNYEQWKKDVLEIEKKVDAFFIAKYGALKDEAGEYVSNTKVAAWYLMNVKSPEAASAGQLVKQGMLCSVDDSGFNQGYQAVVIAHDIMANGAKLAAYAPVVPGRGALTVNKQRAKMLGITLMKNMGIEQYVEKASVLEDKIEQ